MVATKTTVLIPAPTVASVKATSTAPISAQSRHIKKLYTPKTTADTNKSFTYRDATAETTKSKEQAYSSMAECDAIAYVIASQEAADTKQIIDSMRSFEEDLNLRDQLIVSNRIERLRKAGLIGRIFTDNVDNMLSKVDVQFERVRGSGVFNERYEAKFQNPTLIVIGVAADRRQIIAQARKQGLRIVVVNPCYKVSPNVTHLDYLRREDTFYRTEAEKFFRNVAPTT